MNYRRELHRYPEAAWCEFFTTSRIAAHLAHLKYQLAYSDEIIHNDAIMGRDQEQIQKAQERALRWGADNHSLELMNGVTGIGAILDTGKQIGRAHV